MLGALASIWQRAEIEAKLAGLQAVPSQALPPFTESKRNGKALLEVVVERPDSTVTLYAGGGLARRWTATKGRPVHVLCEPGTYPLVIEVREVSQTKIHSGQFTTAGGKAYLLEFR